MLISKYPYAVWKDPLYCTDDSVLGGGGWLVAVSACIFFCLRALRCVGCTFAVAMRNAPPLPLSIYKTSRPVPLPFAQVRVCVWSKRFFVGVVGYVGCVPCVPLYIGVKHTGLMLYVFITRPQPSQQVLQFCL